MHRMVAERGTMAQLGKRAQLGKLVVVLVRCTVERVVDKLVGMTAHRMEPGTMVRLGTRFGQSCRLVPVLGQSTDHRHLGMS